MNEVTVETLIGNQRVKKYLCDMIDRKRIAHSLLFSGPDGVGKCSFAFAAAKRIVSSDKINHPDIHLLKPSGKLCLHNMESMRTFANETFMPPYKSDYKVFIILDAHCMHKESANALLKTFEEPSIGTVIILVTHHPELLLPTVISRCCKVGFQLVCSEEIALFLQNKFQLSYEDALSAANRSMGSVSRAIKLIEGENEKRTLLLEFLSKGYFLSYTDFTQHIVALSEIVDKKSQEFNEDIVDMQCLTSIQKNVIEKEREGTIAAQYFNDIEEFFSIILSWYRDLHLIDIAGDSRYLFNGDNLPLLMHAYKNKYMLPLYQVQSTINEVKLAIRRSTSLITCLESLFIKLNFLDSPRANLAPTREGVI